MNIAENRFLCSQHPGGKMSDVIQVVYNNLVCASNQVAVGFNRHEQKILCSSMDGL